MKRYLTLSLVSSVLATPCSDEVLPTLAHALSACSTAAFGKSDIWNPFYALVVELRKPESFILSDYCLGIAGCDELITISNNSSYDCSCWIYKETAINVYQELPTICKKMPQGRTMQLFTRNDKIVNVKNNVLVAAPRLPAFNQTFTYHMKDRQIESNEYTGLCVEVAQLGGCGSTDYNLALAECETSSNLQKWQIQPMLNRFKHDTIQDLCVEADPYEDNYELRVVRCDSSYPATQYFTTTVPYDHGCPAAEYDIDYYGYDLESKPMDQPSSCCLSCNWAPACRAYSWADGICYYKGAANSSNIIPKPGVVSGLVTKCSPWSEKYDIEGLDIGNTPASKKEDCCPICQGTPLCRAFSWSPYRGGTCWLKSGFGNYKASEDVWSGYVIDL